MTVCLLFLEQVKQWHSCQTMMITSNLLPPIMRVLAWERVLRMKVLDVLKKRGRVRKGRKKEDTKIECKMKENRLMLWQSEVVLYNSLPRSKIR